MSFSELVRMALSALGANKLRSALTLLGMVIGVFAIIVAVTAVEVISKSVTQAIESFGSSTFTVYRSWTLQVEGGKRNWQASPALTYDDFEQLRDRALLPVAYSPEVSERNVRFRFGGDATDPVVRLEGSNEDYALNNNYEIGSGRNLTEDDVRLGRPVIVVGADLANKFFANETPIGKDIVGDRGRFRVVGVFKKKGDAFGQNQDMMALTPITTLFNLYGQPDRDLSFKVRAPSQQLVNETMDEVIGHMRVIRRVRAGQENNFQIESNESALEEFNGVSVAVTMGGVGIGLLTLLAAGIGIMNIMLVSVTERTREIGIRKSLGARRRDVLRQFMLEAIVLCQIGGLLGIISGILAGNIVAILFETSFVFPWVWASIAVVGVTFFGLTFGVYPAWKAARLDPIDALRYE